MRFEIGSEYGGDVAKPPLGRPNQAEQDDAALH